MTRLKACLVCLLLMAFVRSNQATAPANISIAEATAAASKARDWMQMQNAGRTLGSGCSEDNCVEACEENWEKNGDHCYLWNNDAKNWTAAEDFCQQAGGHLASVSSNSTNDYIWEGKNRRGLDRVWLGGSDIKEEGVWNWIDCTPWEYTFWQSGEPNNAVVEDRPVENCLEIGRYHDKKWNDAPCGHGKGFVCSKKICPGPEVTTDKGTRDEVTTVEGTGVEVTGAGLTDKGASVMWKPASISLAATLFLFLLF